MVKPGPLLNEVYIPARSGRAFWVKEGQLLKVIDVQGKQVADFFALNPKDPREFLSPTYTRSILGQMNLAEGKPLYSNLRRALLMVEEDPVKKHDMLFAACDPLRYSVDYGIKDHASCQVNVLTALKQLPYTVAVFPDPVNLFQNVTINAQGAFEIREPLTKAGDYILLRALADLVVAVSACPQDQNPCNGWNPTDLRIQIYQRA